MKWRDVMTGGLICAGLCVGYVCYLPGEHEPGWLYHPVVDWLYEQDIVGEKVMESYRVRTSCGDEFAVSTSVSSPSFLFAEGHVLDVYEVRGRDSHLVWEDRPHDIMTAKKPFPPIKPILVYDSPDLRVYSFWDGPWIYPHPDYHRPYPFWADICFLTEAKRDNEWFVWTSADFATPQPGPPDAPGLMTFARALFATGEWRWVERFGPYLASKGNSHARTVLQGYARGEFSTRELQINAAQGLTRVQMQQEARRILLKGQSKS